MKILKNLSFLALILLPILSFSQNGFIEIEVRDSVQIKAISFEYVVSLEEDYDALVEDAEADEKINEMKIDNMKKKRLNDLESFLKNKKYNYSSLSDSSLDVNNSIATIYRSSNEGFKINLSTADEVKKLANDIKSMHKISGTIFKINYEEKSSYEDGLYKKLIEKGKIKALNIAKLSNLTLGKIIEIRDVRESENSNFNFMDMIMKLDKRRNYGMSSDIQNTNYSKAIVIKFKAD